MIVHNTIAYPLGLVGIEYIYANARADNKGDWKLFMNRAEDGNQVHFWCLDRTDVSALFGKQTNSFGHILTSK